MVQGSRIEGYKQSAVVVQRREREKAHAEGISRKSISTSEEQERRKRN